MMRSVKPVNLTPLIAAAFLFATAAALAVLASNGDEAEAGATHTIEVSNFKFCAPGQSPCPATPLDTTVAASVGNTIRFQHVGGSHTASHCTDGTFADCTANLFDFNVTGGTGDWLVPAGVDNSNVYFRCNIHPQMQGLIVVGSPATPTASPSPPPTASPSPPPTASPTISPSPPPTASPTATPTASQAATATATSTQTDTAPATASPATATPAPTLSGRSDVNCDGATDGDDVLALLLHTADPHPAAGPLGSNGCALIGSGNGEGPKGDLNCDGLLNARDALVALYGWAGLPVPGLPQSCPGS